MQTQNDRSNHLKEFSHLITPENLEVLQLIHEMGPNCVASSLSKVHDWLLYFTQYPINLEQKIALLDVKKLSVSIGKVPVQED